MDDKERALLQVMKTTKMHDNFQQMMKTTMSFDERYSQAKKHSERALANAFAQMINLTQRIEYENEREIRRAEEEAKLKGKVMKRVPSRFRNLPAAFRRHPDVVIKYFLGLALGRVVAIILYIVAAFIPALPVPDNIAGSVGKIAGGAFGAIRGFVTDFSAANMINIITNIPTDINKLLQKLGEAIQFYGRRAVAFLARLRRLDGMGAREYAIVDPIEPLNRRRNLLVHHDQTRHDPAVADLRRHRLDDHGLQNLAVALRRNTNDL